jgi:hypothetical protein
MKRRTAVKSLGLALGTLVALPAWAVGWTPDSIEMDNFVSAADEALLAEIVETLIPETNTPGAKSLKVHQFVQRMIVDCYDAQTQASFNQGLAKTEALAQKYYSKSFVSCDALQRTQILLEMGNAPESMATAGLIKDLCIRGYTNSEYYLVNIAKYNIAPGFYHGCVPLPN